ncbi:DUF99 family protein [Candidatus Woesearchaeota archaeon]|nr:DUF99 family protein [Candidatus Woesearchaeota archaeon]
MKKEIRVLGIDDSPFDKFRDSYVTVVGVFFRGGSYADGVVSTKVRVDGLNSTSKLAEMVNRSRFRSQLKCVFIDGLNMAGFNVIDIHRLNALIGIPVIVVVRRKPDIDNIKSVLKKLGMDRKIRLLDKAGPPVKAGKVFIQCAGMTVEKAAELVKLTATHSFIPEPVRVAHLIGAALVNGESKGNA